MKLGYKLLASTAASLFCLGNATAGLHSFNPVTITVSGSNGQISGTLSDAYNSTGLGFFSCNITATLSATSMTCDAMTDTNVQASCQTTAQSLIEVAKTIQQDSFVILTYNASLGGPQPPQCLSIMVQHGSKTPPKAP